MASNDDSPPTDARHSPSAHGMHSSSPSLSLPPTPTPQLLRSPASVPLPLSSRPSTPATDVVANDLTTPTPSTVNDTATTVPPPYDSRCQCGCQELIVDLEDTNRTLIEQRPRWIRRLDLYTKRGERLEGALLALIRHWDELQHEYDDLRDSWMALKREASGLQERVREQGKLIEALTKHLMRQPRAGDSSPDLQEQLEFNFRDFPRYATPAEAVLHEAWLLPLYS